MNDRTTAPAAPARTGRASIELAEHGRIARRLAGRQNGHREGAIALLDAMAGQGSRLQETTFERNELKAVVERQQQLLEQQQKNLERAAAVAGEAERVAKELRLHNAELEAKLAKYEPPPGTGPQPDMSAADQAAAEAG